MQKRARLEIVKIKLSRMGYDVASSMMGGRKFEGIDG